MVYGNTKDGLGRHKAFSKIGVSVLEIMADCSDGAVQNHPVLRVEVLTTRLPQYIEAKSLRVDLCKFKALP